MFAETVAAAFARLEQPAPDILFLNYRAPWWLGRQTLAAAIRRSDHHEAAQRQVVYDAAVALTTYLTDTRQPWPEFYPEIGQPPRAQDAPVALLATLDRLLLASGSFAVDPNERDWRGGRGGGREPLRYPNVPLIGRADFNSAWVAVDELLSNQGVPAADVWAAVRQIRSLPDGLAWSETMLDLWQVQLEDELP